jgi:anti-sigma factor RsiW
MNAPQDERLWHYLDGLLTPAEKAEVEREIQRSPELRQRLEALRQVTHYLRTGKMEEPSRNFTNSVMGNLHRQMLPGGLSPRNGLLLLLGIVVALLSISFLMGKGSYDSQTLVPLDQLNAPGQVMPDLPSFHVNAKWIISALMVVAMGLAFVVLDQTVLRPFLKKRLLHP